MLKRTKGRLLLTLLVITGFAGTLSETALTKQERKFAVMQLKDTKANVVKSVKGLSEAQLNFKATPERWSITECVYHLTMAENALWGMFVGTMKSPATPEKRSELKLSDQEVISMIENRTKTLTAPEMLLPGKATWKTAEEALTSFKNDRGEHLKYVKTTTEDLRNHIFQLPIGAIDGYQFLLFMAAHSDRHTQQINEVKTSANYPQQ